jgi:hypothetical protein
MASKEKLLSREEDKSDYVSMERQYFEDNSLMTSVPNTNFEMKQSNLISNSIRSKDLKAKIEEYLETDGLTRDQVKLLLKQGAEDNHLFMLKEDTYDKLVDSLGLQLDNDSHHDQSNLSKLLTSLKRQTVLGRDSQAANIRNLEQSANYISLLMKSRQVLKGKSISNFMATHDIRKDQDLSASINVDDDSKSVHLNSNYSDSPSLKLKDTAPKYTNQGVKNVIVFLFFLVLSILLF